jgi:predicted Zn-dependent protease
LITRLIAFASTIAVLLAGAASAYAKDDRPGYIRDAETERIIRGFAAPLFEAAGLDAEGVRIYIVKDDRFNAFVAGGMNLFLHTGLIMGTESPGELIAVIAHETGHIAGGHLARGQAAMETASIESIIGFVLGVGAAMVGGQGAAGGAVIGAGQSIAMQSMLQFSREQEAAADQAALQYLDATRQSARGMADSLEALKSQDVLMGGQQNPYLRTHPLSNERLNAVKHHLKVSRYTDTPDPPERVAAFRRMVAKLVGFTKTKAETLRRYPESDTDFEARYARAIAYYRANDLKTAIPLVDGLIAEQPRDPYLHELKGQMLYEHGRIEESLAAIRTAVDLAPDEPLLRFALAQSQVGLEDPSANKSAIQLLEQVTASEPRYPPAWRLLAVAYGRDGQLGMAAVALAEAAMARGQRKEAREQAERALQQLPEGSPGWLRANDILSFAGSGAG